MSRKQGHWTDHQKALGKPGNLGETFGKHLQFVKEYYGPVDQTP